MKIVKWVSLSLIIILVGLASVFHWSTRPERLIDLIEKKYKCHCQIDELNYSIFDSPMGAKVAGIKIYSIEAKEDPILTLKNAQLGVSGLLSNNLVIENIEIEGAILHLKVNENGEANWDDFRSKKKKKKKKKERREGLADDSEKEDEGNGLEKIRRITINDATIIYDNPSKKLYAKLHQIKIETNLAAKGLFSASGELVASKNSTSPTFTTIGWEGSVSYLAEDHLSTDLTFDNESHITNQFPIIIQATKLIDKVRDFGIKIQNFPEKITLRRDRQLKLSLIDDVITIQSPLAVSAKGWEITVQEGASFDTITTDHRAQLTAGANERLSQDIQQRISKVLKKIPRRARKSVEKTINRKLFKNDRLAIEIESSGRLTKPKVKSDTKLPDAKDFLKDSAKDLLRGLFDR